MNAKNLLERLVVEATNAIAMPGRVLPEDMAELAERLQREYDKPAPDGRLVHEEDLLLAHTLGMYARTRMREGLGSENVPLPQVIGVLLPHARSHLFAAMRARPSTTDQTRT